MQALAQTLPNANYRNTWSNFSRDGSLYVDGPFYGSLNGGPLTRYAAGGDVLVGWTTL